MVGLTSEQLNQLQFFLKTFSKTQLIWVSGYILGLVNAEKFKQNSQNIVEYSNSAKLLKECVDHHFDPVVIISASQTGNASRIAKELKNEFLESGLNVVLFNAGEYAYKKISKIKSLIFITSTHGEGEPPEEAIPLYQYLFSKKAPKLNNIDFSVLSLGDRSYEHFAKAGKDFDKKFEELGGNRLFTRVDVDVDFKTEVNIWKKQIIDFFIAKKNVILDSGSNNNLKNRNFLSKNNKLYSKEHPIIAHLSHRQKITSRNSEKDVYHLEIDIKGSNIRYFPGDALGVWYENDSNLINELLTALHISDSELVEFQGKLISLKEVLQKNYELTQNHPSVLQKIANISQDKLLLDILTDQKKINSFILSTPLIDIIKESSIKLSSQDLLRVLRPMKPRFYSISSAQSEVGEEIHITVGAVRYKVGENLRFGGASGYLIDRLQENDELRIFVETNDNFRLPKNPESSIIMIGSGTGIAPFRAFIQERALNQSTGKNWLFFGNLRFVDDFLYQIEWQRYMKLGLLNRIDTAWSRDQAYKIYVQDKLLQNSIEIWDWIQSGAYIYVCGDAKHMARDVEQALNSLTVKHGKMDLQQANDFWNDMRIQRRYQRDVY